MGKQEAVASALKWREFQVISDARDVDLDMRPAVRITMATTPRGQQIFSYTYGVIRKGSNGFEPRMHIPDSQIIRYVELIQTAAGAVGVERANHRGHRFRVPLPEVIKLR